MSEYDLKSLFNENTLSTKKIKNIISFEDFNFSKFLIDILRLALKVTIEKVLEAEIEIFFDKEPKSDNCRNGYYEKTIRTILGKIKINIPRDRNGKFKSKFISKYSCDIFNINSQIISLYKFGLSIRDITSSFQEFYNLTLSTQTVSNIINKTVYPLFEKWKNRTLNKTYYITFFDAVYFAIREGNKVVNKAIYVVIGINFYGNKEILGVYIGKNENTKAWKNILKDLNNRGIKNMFIACVDGSPGFKEALKDIFPMSSIQRCINHLTRSALKSISSSIKKEISSDLKGVYTASFEREAYLYLQNLKIKYRRNRKESNIMNYLEQNWGDINLFFSFSDELRKIIYTTNIVESTNRAFRKVTKTKSVFPTDKSLLILLYLRVTILTEKWKNESINNWTTLREELIKKYREKNTCPKLSTTSSFYQIQE